MSSLKCWLRKIEKQDKISKEDLSEIINLLDGHDKAIRADERIKAIDEFYETIKKYNIDNSETPSYLIDAAYEEMKGRT